MLGYVYHTAFWTATKLEDEQPGQPSAESSNKTEK